MLAHHFGEIGNKDIQQHRNEHSKDIGDLLRKFVAAGWLNKDGQGSGSRYQWPNITNHLLPDSSEHLPSSSEHLNNSPEHLPSSSEHLDEELEKQLLQIALPVQRAGKKVSKAIMEEIILALCAIDWLTLRTLARLLDRKPDYLRNHFIAPMLKDGRLELKMPGTPSHPKQAYRKTGLL
jgi:ATP-dependent DNA helicase RecG